MGLLKVGVQSLYAIRAEEIETGIADFSFYQQGSINSPPTKRTNFSFQFIRTRRAFHYDPIAVEDSNKKQYNESDR